MRNIKKTLEGRKAYKVYLDVDSVDVVREFVGVKMYEGGLSGFLDCCVRFAAKSLSDPEIRESLEASWDHGWMAGENGELVKVPPEDVFQRMVIFAHNAGNECRMPSVEEIESALMEMEAEGQP